MQVKVTTGALERQQQGNPPKGNGSASGDHRPLLSSYPSWLIFLFLFGNKDRVCRMASSHTHRWQLSLSQMIDEVLLARPDTCSPFMWNRHFSSSRMPRPRSFSVSQHSLESVKKMPKDGLLHKSRWIQGQLGRTSIFCFSWEKTGRAPPENFDLCSILWLYAVPFIFLSSGTVQSHFHTEDFIISKSWGN